MRHTDQAYRQAHHNRYGTRRHRALSPEINTQRTGAKYQQHIKDPKADIKKGNQAHLRVNCIEKFAHAIFDIGGFTGTTGEKLKGNNIGVAIDYPPGHQRARIGL